MHDASTIRCFNFYWGGRSASAAAISRARVSPRQEPPPFGSERMQPGEWYNPPFVRVVEAKD